LQAQESAFVANHQGMAILPGNVKNVSICDGEVYCFSSEVMLKAQRSGEQVLGFWADTSFVKLAEGIEYVVRQPQTGDLYFTLRDKKDRSYLYRCRDYGSPKPHVEQVRLGGGWFNKGMTVEHPTFTTDGRILIFTSLDSKNSYGGYDLWYSQFDGKHWSKPENLGKRVNTSADEISPVIYYDCLIFASNGHDEDHGYLNLYSTRLISDRVVGDTVGMLQIGRCRVQRLPEPLNAEDADDFDLAIDTARGCGYWVSKRVATDSDSQVFSFTGTLDGVLLWGIVSDQFGNPLPNVRVTVRQGDEVVCNVYSDEAGQYRVYLQCGQYYDLSFQSDDYFVSFETVNTTKGEEEFLISEDRLDVRLDRLPIGQRIYFDDLFGPDVDVELSERGMERLNPLVRFLIDNPGMKVEMTLTNDLTTDSSFNSLLTASRIQTLENYLYPMLPPTIKFNIVNGCAGRVSCDSASGLSRLTVLINK
jgi:hypothetical protein